MAIAVLVILAFVALALTGKLVCWLLMCVIQTMRWACSWNLSVEPFTKQQRSVGYITLYGRPGDPPPYTYPREESRAVDTASTPRKQGDTMASIFGKTSHLERFFKDRAQSSPGKPGSALRQAEPRTTSPPPPIPDVMRHFDDLVGMEPLRDVIREYVALLAVQQRRGGPNAVVRSPHIIFTGSPGTGKTEVAKRMGMVLKELGILQKGHLVPASRGHLVGQFIGDTAPLVNAMVEKAKGGVLFMDEAYSLCSSKKDSPRDFGHEAVATLLERLENDRGSFVCIAAGYSQEMESFLDTNPGLRSRFTMTIHFPDYGPDDLMVIARNLLKQGRLTLAEDATPMLRSLLAQKVRLPGFANARTARSLVERLVARQAVRLTTAPAGVDQAQITAADVAEVSRRELPAGDPPVPDHDVPARVRTAVAEHLAGMAARRKRLDSGNLSPLTYGVTLPDGGEAGPVVRWLSQSLTRDGFQSRATVTAWNAADLLGRSPETVHTHVADAFARASGGLTLIEGVDDLARYPSRLRSLLASLSTPGRPCTVVLSADAAGWATVASVCPGAVSLCDARWMVPALDQEDALALFRALLARDGLTLQPDGDREVARRMRQLRAHPAWAHRVTVEALYRQCRNNQAIRLAKAGTTATRDWSSVVHMDCPAADEVLPPIRKPCRVPPPADLPSGADAQGAAVADLVPDVTVSYAPMHSTAAPPRCSRWWRWVSVGALLAMTVCC
jgi:DNA polymerase III delta prime subunit